MTPKYHHATPPAIPTRPRCPVCGATVYSLAGIHPQCAVRQADLQGPKSKPPGAASQAAQPAKAAGPAGAETAVAPSRTASRSASIET